MTKNSKLFCVIPAVYLPYRPRKQAQIVDDPWGIANSSTKMPKTVDETKIAGPKASNLKG